MRMGKLGSAAALLLVLAPLPAAAQAVTRLNGSFYGTRQWGEDLTALVLPEDMTTDEPESVVRVKEKGPGVDAAIGTMELISWETKSPLGVRLNRGCTTKCKVTGTITLVDRATGDWRFTAVSAVEALPDDFDFLTLSRYPGAAAHAKRVTLHDVGPGDPLRATLLETLRSPVERDLRQKLRFQVLTLRTMDNYAFAEVAPQTPAGGKISLAGTRHAARQRDGMMDGDHVFALLQMRAGKWEVREWVIGPTDAAWSNWAQAYGAPEALFLVQ